MPSLYPMNLDEAFIDLDEEFSSGFGVGFVAGFIAGAIFTAVWLKVVCRVK